MVRLPREGSLGIIQRARRERNYAELNGWLVTEHDSISIAAGIRCEMSPSMSPKTASDVIQNGFKCHPPCHPRCHPTKGSDVTFLVTNDVTLEAHQLEENEDTYFDDPGELTRLYGPDLPRPSFSQPLESKSVLKEEPGEHRADDAGAVSDASLENLDPDPDPLPLRVGEPPLAAFAARPSAEPPPSAGGGAVPTSGVTVGDVLGKFIGWRFNREDGTLACVEGAHVYSHKAIITNLSDGEFDTKFLNEYRNTEELGELCADGIFRAMDQLFRGPKTLAKIMGGVMERMRTRGLDVPKGWYPAMKRLRERAKQAEAERHSDDDF